MRLQVLPLFLLLSLTQIQTWAFVKHSVVKKTPMPMTAPLYLEGESYASTLYLVNSLNFGIEADITLYDLNGAQLTTKRTFMKANSQQSFRIKEILSEGGLYSEAGSVEVISPTNATALLGQLSVTRLGASAEYLDEEMFMPNVRGTNTIRAVIDSPQNSPIVAITNTSPTRVDNLHVNCIRNGVEPGTQRLFAWAKANKISSGVQ